MAIISFLANGSCCDALSQSSHISIIPVPILNQSCKFYGENPHFCLIDL